MAGGPESGERGTALVIALLASMLLAALGTGLLVVCSTETRVAASYRTSLEMFYAADAGLHLAMADLAGMANWTDALTGAAPAALHDSTHHPVLATRQQIDLDAITTELQAETNSAAVWGADNPLWRLFAWGPLSSAASGITSREYLAVWIADDGADHDGDPLRDTNRLVRLHAEAYASAETRRIIEATVSQTASGVRVLAWREVR